VRGRGADPQRPPSAGELAGEQDVRELARLIGAQAVVALGHVQVVGYHGRIPRGTCPAGRGDDPAPRSGKRFPQQRGQQEDSQVVHLEGELVLVGGDDPLRPGYQPGVVKQHVHAGVPGPQLAREIPDLVEMGEVGDVAFGARLRGDGARLVR
jgi:hypothetical protein